MFQLYYEISLSRYHFLYIQSCNVRESILIYNATVCEFTKQASSDRLDSKLTNTGVPEEVQGSVWNYMGSI